MNYFDPARPQLSEGVPCYVDPQGKPIAALQDITVRICPGSEFELSLMLLVGHNVARWFEYRVTSWTHVARVLLSYRDDPERTLRDFFGYEYKVLPMPPPQPTKPASGKISNINIDDLFTP